MAKIPRITAKIFAGKAQEEDLGQFGSALTGTKITNTDISVLQELPAYEEGWRGAVISERNYPTLEEMNSVQRIASQQIAYTLQNGMPEWDEGTTYYTDQFCRVGTNFYYSKIDNNIGNNPDLSPDEWELWSGGGGGKGASRNIGELVYSILPQTDAGLHLLDGTLISGAGSYLAFVSHIATLYGDGSNIPAYFTTEEEWQQSVTQYGVCGKFVYNKEANTVRLPKVTGLVEGTLDGAALGSLIEAGLPALNISATINSAGAHTHSRGTMEINGQVVGGNDGVCSWSSATGSFHAANSSAAKGNVENTGGSSVTNKILKFTASRAWTGATSSNGAHTHDITINNTSSPIFGKNEKVQSQAIKGYIYMVIATSAKTDIQVDIDNIAHDLSLKAETDLSNLTPAGEKHFLNKTQLTNCILEVPQRIKWEVIDGVFYIKAGSVLTRPNGWIDKEQGIRKFEYKTLDTNIALSQITNKNTVNVILFFVGAKQSGNEGLWYFDNEINVFSQDTPPAVSIAANMWYDTDNNIIKYTTDSGKNWIDEEIYFPTGIVSIANGAFDSVVDIFNGSGFIGSCGWVDRGVKALFSNGRNNDGTLKNVEASTTEIFISNPSGYSNAVSHMLLELNQDNSVTLGWLLHVYEGYVLPSIVSSDNEYFYHKTENIWYYHKVNETEWQKATKIPIILRRCWFDENTRIQSSSVNTAVALAKEQDIDGQYTNKTLYLVQNGTLAKDYNKTFDLSNYLPNDNHPYMVLVDVILRTGSAVNNSFGLYAKSNLMSNAGCLCRAVTRTDKVNAIAGCTSFIPVGSDHTISLLAGDESNAGTFADRTMISLNGYRRIR